MNKRVDIYNIVLVNISLCIFVNTAKSLISFFFLHLKRFCRTRFAVSGKHMWKGATPTFPYHVWLCGYSRMLLFVNTPSCSPWGVAPFLIDPSGRVFPHSIERWPWP